MCSWTVRVRFVVVAVLVIGMAGAAVSRAGSAVAGPAGSCPASASSEGAAALAARACAGRVEAISGRTPYAQEFINPDGSTTVETSVVPARVLRPDGSWASADPTLVAAGGGWVPRAALVDVVVSGGGSGPFVVFRRGGETLTLSWPLGSLPAGVVSGASVRYPSVLPGVDLWVVVSVTGFRPVLQVADAAAASNPALRAVSYVVGGSVHGVATPDGRVRLLDSEDHLVAVTDAAVMWDSTTDPTAQGGEAQVSTAAQAGDFARVADVGVTSAGQDLTLRPDASMLAGQATQWPVFIDPGISPSQNRFAYADSANANNTTDHARVGLDPGDGRLYRSFFNFPTSEGSLTWRGKQILTAEFDIELWHSYACSDSQDDWVWAYHTAAISTSPRMPWSGSGSRWLPASGGVTAQGHAHKTANDCGVQPDVLMRFSGQSLTNEVKVAASHKDTTFTIGLCACNTSGLLEDSQFRWKQFYIDSRAKLIVTYNTVPGVPANLNTSGTACGSVVGTLSPYLSAQAVDGDTDDTLTVTFQYQQLPSGPLTTPPARSGVPANDSVTVDLSLPSSADGTSYQWRVQTQDSHNAASPWSSWCTFSVDIAAPPTPTVQPSGSPSYTPCDPEAIDSCPSDVGGPGVSGSFTLGPNGAANVISFKYGWTTPPTTSVMVAAGSSVTVAVTPPRFGLNTLYVSSSNGVKSSPIKPYQFLVGKPGDPIAWWPLDSIRGHDFTDQISDTALTVNSGVSWTADARYIGVRAASFSGDSATGYATGVVPALDTSKSFSVAAWVRPSAIPTNAPTAVAQDAGGAGDDSSFYLGLRQIGSPATPRWAFMLKDSPSSADDAVIAFSTAPLDSSTVGKWTYLVGVFDAAEKAIRLYVNGVLVASASRTAAPWKGTGPVSIGRSQFNGTNADPWIGQIADVRLWNRVVTPDDIAGVDADPTIGVPDAKAGLMHPLLVGSWDFSDVADCFCGGPAADRAPTADQETARDLYLDPGWVDDPPTSQFVLETDDGALRTDGTAGYASTTDPDLGVARPVLRTDQSFSVSAWVKLETDPDSLPTVNSTVVAQDGGTVSAFYLGYNYTHSSQPGWSFKLSGSDTVPVVSSVAWFGEVDTEWIHLVGVYDAVAHTNKLYVNGALVATATGASSFQADGSLKVGAALWRGALADPFPGLVDQVQVWQGVLSDREVADLDLPDAQQNP